MFRGLQLDTLVAAAHAVVCFLSCGNIVFARSSWLAAHAAMDGRLVDGQAGWLFATGLAFAFGAATGVTRTHQVLGLACSAMVLVANARLLSGQVVPAYVSDSVVQSALFCGWVVVVAVTSRT